MNLTLSFPVSILPVCPIRTTPGYQSHDTFNSVLQRELKKKKKHFFGLWRCKSNQYQHQKSVFNAEYLYLESKVFSDANSDAFCSYFNAT